MSHGGGEASPGQKPVIRVIAIALLGVLVLSGSACPMGDDDDDRDDSASGSSEAPCDAPGSACPARTASGGFAEFCALVDGGGDLACLNVCENHATFAEGTVSPGDFCEYDTDCASGSSCDNDVLGGGATCRCVTTPTCTTELEVSFWSDALLLGRCSAAAFVLEFGSSSTGDWDMKRTCKRTDGSCAQDDEEIGIGRTSDDNTDLCWARENDAGAKEYSTGRLCASDFSFSRTTDSGEYETGVFHFGTEDSFEANWIVYDTPGGEIVARCIGKGRADAAGGDPDDPPDCDAYGPFDPFDAGTSTVDFTGTFNERFSCVSQSMCVDQDESGQIVISAGATPGNYVLSGGGGKYAGVATLSGLEMSWGASYVDPLDPAQSYTETGTYLFSADGDRFDVTSAYTITGTGITGSCTGKAERAPATPGPPSSLPPCP